jgi:hypothetical protein
MVDKLRAKPGGEHVVVRLADFGRDRLGDDFALVFVACNTFFTLVDQSSQVAFLVSSVPRAT